VREHQLRLVPRRGTGFQEPLHIGWTGEDVEIFGGLVDAGLMNERKRAPYQKRDVRPVQYLHGVAIE
jgi:hypothetical protein